MTDTNRARRRAATRSAILDEAWSLFARSGPDGVSVREITTSAGCSHTLVARYFGSKQGLVEAVADRLSAGVEDAAERASRAEAGRFAALLDDARRDRKCVQLLVRCGLGELGDPAQLASSFGLDRLIAGRIRETGPAKARDVGVRVGAYAAASLMLGWLTLDGFLVAATRLAPVEASRRDGAMAAAASTLLEAGPTLQLSRAVHPPQPDPTEPQRNVDSRTAILDSAVALFAEHGPAALSLRQIARHAHVNLGLIHRHFGSKQALLAEAIEQGIADVLPAALDPAGFDLDTVVGQLHHGSRGVWIIARALVDDIDIATVRAQYPVVHQLLDAFGPPPRGAGPGDLSDPRLAVAATCALVVGSVFWGPALALACGVADDVALEPAIADLARTLLAGPAGTAPTPANR